MMFSLFLFADDLDVSVDFFEYFLSLYPILKDDPTLWCVSAWNDNGKENMISNDAGEQIGGVFHQLWFWWGRATANLKVDPFKYQFLKRREK